MSNLKFTTNWQASDNGDAIDRDTSAQLFIQLDTHFLTKNEEVWSQTVRDSIFVSTYPLALWFASSWWRLNYETLPPQRSTGPSLDWRMAHELGAASQGFVWPRILFIPDGEVVNVWTEPMATPGQSLQYLHVQDRPKSVQAKDFRHEVSEFVERVINRLNARGHANTDLEQLWAFVRDDRNDEQIKQARILEAQFGFDPEECPADVLKRAFALERETGAEAMSELAPIVSSKSVGAGLDQICELSRQHGLLVKPEMSLRGLTLAAAGAAPWERGASAAQQFRDWAGNRTEPLKDDELFGFFGLTSEQADKLGATGQPPVSVAKPEDGNSIELITRKRHPRGKRFELARILGDMLARPRDSRDWIVSSDLTTARQKQQRAFAAELLCPFASLQGVLDGDYTEASLEAAADYFNVSERTIESSLRNHGCLGGQDIESRIPYRLAA